MRAAPSPTWKRAAARLRVLQLVQLTVLALVCGTVALLGIHTANQLQELVDTQNQVSATHAAVIDARDELTDMQLGFFRAKAADPARKVLTPELVLAALSSSGRMKSLAETDTAWMTPRAHGAARTTASRLDELMALVQGNATTRPGSARDRRALEELERLSAELNGSVDVWVDEIRAAEVAETVRIAGLRDQLTRRLQIAIVAILLLAILVWLMLDRARGRVVAMLRSLAEDQRVHGDISAAVTQGKDRGTVCRIATDHLHDPPHTTGAAVARAGPDGVPELEVVTGVVGPHLEAVLARGISTASQADMRTDDGQRVIAAPILVDGECWGAVAVGLLDDDRPAAAAEARLQTLAPPLSLAIARLLADERLADEASTDPLTSLLNHRVFHERLRETLARSDREQSPVSLVLLDIDHFRTINDALGHQAGDAVLVEVARRLHATAREGDVVARVGGEEFAWLMPGTTGSDAAAAAERARQAIGDQAMGPVSRVTVSCGVACTQDRSHGTGLMERADTAIYWAKANGRDLATEWTSEIDRVVNSPDRTMRMAQMKALSAVQSLARAVDARDPYTHQHSERVARLAHRLALESGWGDDAAGDLLEAALVHDVGKVGVPDRILLKPSGLTDDEYETVKLHAPLGAQIVTGVLSTEQVAWVRGHHERFDGRGYPDGLSAMDIPDGARLLAVADAWDAMTSDRPYRTGCAPDEAYAVCVAERGRQLCPDAVDALTRLREAGLLLDSACLPDDGGRAVTARRSPLRTVTPTG